MDILGLKNQQEDRKIKEVKVPGTDVTLRVRCLLPMDLDKISKKRELYKKANGRMNIEAYVEAVMDETIIAWENVTNGDQPLPCIKENKILLDKLLHGFRGVWKEAAGLREVEDEEDGGEIPN